MFAVMLCRVKFKVEPQSIFINVLILPVSFLSYAKLILKQLPRFIVCSSHLPLALDGLKFYIKPRSDAYIILWKTFVAQYYRPHRENVSYPVIVDVGAYIGAFTLWACKRYKPCKIIALEPHKELFELLQRNISANGFEDVVFSVNKSLLEGSSGTLIHTPLISGTGVTVAAGKGDTDTSSLQELFDIYDLKIVDYFKMDIEGGEAYVLTDKNKKLFKSRIKFVSMETHSNQRFPRIDSRKYFTELGFDIIETRIFNGNSQLEAYNKAL